MIICNAFLPQLLCFKPIRTNIVALFVISIFVNIGMWFERYVIIVVSLAGEPFERFANATYNPTWADWGIMSGELGSVSPWLPLFFRTVPSRSVRPWKRRGP